MSSHIAPEEFDLVAKLAFAPVYPYLARRIKEKFGVDEGICLDIGSGPGLLAVEMARLTHLMVYSLDIKLEMTRIAWKNIAEARLSSRVFAVTADVCNMPFEDGSIDLAVSRGSIPFWKDRPAALREIFRVLRPGGAAYIGGGFGSDEIKASVMNAFSTNPELAQMSERFFGGMKRQRLQPQDLRKDLARGNVPGTVEEENCGIWAQIIKPRA